MDVLIINKIETNKNVIIIDFETNGKWNKVFKQNKFFCEYNTALGNIPEEIAVIPFLGNIVPIAWFFDLEVRIEKVDQDFYKGLTQVKTGYKNMYPSIKFGGNIKAEQLIKRQISGKNSSAACFFSGGADAYYTFLRHKNEIAALVTVWGADILLDDIEGWKKVRAAIQKTADIFDLNFCSIKSNFREIFDNPYLGKCINHKGWSWWHEFQHGMGLITLLAPIAYKNKYSTVYIASSYTADVKNLTCASDPSIDNYVEFAGCKTIHDGFSANRQDKIRYIVNYARSNPDKVELRVCWASKGGENCCSCEKCCRTMMAIYLEDGDPKELGFNSTDADLKTIARNMRYKNSGLPRDWDIIHEKMIEKYNIEEVPKEWKWFYKGGTASINNNVYYRFFHFGNRIRRKLERIFRGKKGK